MTMDRTQYCPINCEFHDLLEDLATARRPSQIRFRDESGTQQHRIAAITDVFSSNGAEYLTMNTGETVRLDQLVEVNGARLADYAGMSA